MKRWNSRSKWHRRTQTRDQARCSYTALGKGISSCFAFKGEGGGREECLLLVVGPCLLEGERLRREWCWPAQWWRKASAGRWRRGSGTPGRMDKRLGMHGDHWDHYPWGGGAAVTIKRGTGDHSSD